jgi:hypothetical protein
MHDPVNYLSVNSLRASILARDLSTTVQRGLAVLEIDNGCLDPLLGKRIESLLEQLPVAGNRVVKLVARIAHALTALILAGAHERSRSPVIAGRSMIEK